MFVTIVHVKVKPEHVDDFIQAMTENHLESVKEPGNLRFDVLQKSEDPTEFALYEAYESREASAAHKHTSPLPEVAGSGGTLDGASKGGGPVRGTLSINPRIRKCR